MRNLEKQRRFAGCLLILGLAWILASCASVDSTGGVDSGQPGTASAGRISIPDAELRTALPGAWTQERAALARFDWTFFEDGRSEAVVTRPVSDGIQTIRTRGTWKIENGALLMTTLKVEPEGAFRTGEKDRCRIVSLSETEIVLAPEAGQKITLRKRLPVSPLMAEFREKARLIEVLTTVRDGVLAGYDKLTAGTRGAEETPPRGGATRRSVMMMAYDPERLAGDILRDAEAGLNPDEFRTIISWEESPLGRKYTELSIATERPETEEAVNVFIADLRRHPPTPARLRLVEDMDRKLKITENSVDLILGLQVARVMGTNAILSPETAPPLDKVSEESQKQRPTMITMLEPLVIGRKLYTFRTLADAEVEEIHGFETSDLGRKYNDVMAAALSKAMIEAEARFWQTMAEAARMQRTRKGT